MGINPIDVRLVISDKPKENLFNAIVVDILPMERVHRIRMKLLNQQYYITMDLERLACEKWKVKIGQILQKAFGVGEASEQISLRKMFARLTNGEAPYGVFSCAIDTLT